MIIKIDHKFRTDPKTIRAGGLAGWLHIQALCYCNEHLTDGFISTPAVIQLWNWVTDLDEFNELTGELAEYVPDNIDLARRLVNAGLWEEAEDGNPGFYICGFLKGNRSKAQVLEARRVDAARNRENRSRKTTNKVMA